MTGGCLLVCEGGQPNPSALNRWLPVLSVRSSFLQQSTFLDYIDINQHYFGVEFESFGGGLEHDGQRGKGKGGGSVLLHNTEQTK